ncbi:hypothetical protein COW46_03210 [Candidatus Gracilibacteria bacterium CG17_big_fil_post_rev_8_21_14_2_50_48_13]|nr:MAG: hypothetical protein COW46_03210 [Candidatus Gracilibacteria bacterium CG17_big_fil_post_rev_8_21_14_2_50_48_13]
MKKRYIFGLGTLGVVLIGGFIVFGGNKGNTLEYETTTMSGTTVRTLVSVVGSVKAEKETTLAFAKNGTVQSVQIKEGARVSSGQILAELKKDDLTADVDRTRAALAIEKSTLAKLRSGLPSSDRAVLDVSVRNAEVALSALRQTVNATKSRLEKELEESRLAYDNAQQLYTASKASTLNVNNADIRSIQAALSSSKASLAAILTTNEQSIRSAEIAYENAKKELAANSPISNKNLADAQERSFYDASKYMDEVDKSLRAINEILTIEDYNKDTNAAFKNLLGVTKTNAYNDAYSSYLSLRQNFQANRSLFLITGGVLSYEEILRRIDTERSLLDQSYTTLTVAYTMLENSVTSVDLTQTKLNAFRDSILLQRSTVSSSISALSTVRQNIENLELQKNSSVTTLENRVNAAAIALEAAKAQASAAETNARSSVTAAEENLAKATAGLGAKDIDLQRLENAVQEAQKRLASAEARYTEQIASSAKSISDLEAQVRSAEAQKSAQISLARPEDIQIQESRVRQAEIALRSAEDNLDDAYIRAPKPGIIAKVAIAEGEIASPSGSAIALISEDFSTIETNIAENEIASVSPGQTVMLTFDAFDSETIYTGRVTFIDPAQTALDGVIYYRTEITFDPLEFPGKTVRPGFSANLDIITEEKETTAIPVQALKDAGEKGKKVEVLVGEGKEKKTEERFVTTGLVGDEYVEILSGLTPSDKVVLSTTDPTKK